MSFVVKFSAVLAVAGFATAFVMGQPVQNAQANIVAPNMFSNLSDATQCMAHIDNMERQHGIPRHLLLAISMTESGRYNKSARMVMPWPWTINVEGQGYRYNSKTEAVQAVRSFQRQGRKSIDIGCMQVNLKHHPDAFASLEQAFDPQHNVRYAAQFLSENYQQDRNWQQAAASYHSRTPARGMKYLGIVRKNWQAANARLGGGNYASLGNVQMGSLQSTHQNGVIVSAPRPFSSNRERLRSPMKIIDVRQPQNPVRAGVSVVRPASSVSVRSVQPVASQVAMNTPTSSGAQPYAKVIRVNAPANQALQGYSVPRQVPVPSKSSGQGAKMVENDNNSGSPRFIFR